MHVVDATWRRNGDAIRIDLNRLTARDDNSSEDVNTLFRIQSVLRRFIKAVSMKIFYLPPTEHNIP